MTVRAMILNPMSSTRGKFMCHRNRGIILSIYLSYGLGRFRTHSKSIPIDHKIENMMNYFRAYRKDL